MTARRRRGGDLPTRPRRGEAASEGGFTLLEILIAVSVLGLILVTLTVAVMMGFRNNARAEATTDRSNLVSFTTRLFNRDVASATAAPTVGAGCGTPTPAVNIPLEGGTSAAYVVVTTSSPPRSALVRRVCNGATVVSSEEIGATKWALTATASCTDTGSVPDTVTCGRLTFGGSWGGPEPFSFSLSAERRATAS